MMPVTGRRYANPSNPFDSRTHGAHNLVRTAMNSDENASWQQEPPPYGQLGPMTIEEAEKYKRDSAAQQAVYVLEQARQIRANPALMADVRAHIRKLRDDGAALLDDIGG